MFKGANIIFFSAHLMFFIYCFHVLLRVFHVSIHDYFLFLSKYDLKWYFIISSNQSWIGVHIALHLVCKPIS